MDRECARRLLPSLGVLALLGLAMLLPMAAARPQHVVAQTAGKAGFVFRCWGTTTVPDGGEGAEIPFVRIGSYNSTGADVTITWQQARSVLQGQSDELMSLFPLRLPANRVDAVYFDLPVPGHRGGQPGSLGDDFLHLEEQGTHGTWSKASASGYPSFSGPPIDKGGATNADGAKHYHWQQSPGVCRGVRHLVRPVAIAAIDCGSYPTPTPDRARVIPAELGTSPQWPTGCDRAPAGVEFTINDVSHPTPRPLVHPHSGESVYRTNYVGQFVVYAPAGNWVSIDEQVNTRSYAANDDPLRYHVESGESDAHRRVVVVNTPACKTDSPTRSEGYNVLRCRGFAPNESVAVHWETAAGPALATGTASGSGSVLMSVRVPKAPRGFHAFVAIGAVSGKRAEAAFSVRPRAWLLPPYGWVDESAKLVLEGYAADTEVAVTWTPTGGGAAVELGRTRTSATGNGEVAFRVPAAPRGFYVVEGRELTGDRVAVADEYEIRPRLKLTALEGRVGAPAVAELTGFAPSESVDLRWYDAGSATGPFRVIESVVTNPDGEMRIPFDLPEATAGRHEVEAYGSAGTKRTGPIYINRSIVLNPDRGPAGIGVAVTLRGFAAGQPIDVKWWVGTGPDLLVATAVASASGSASASFVAPNGTLGKHRVTGASPSGSVSVDFLLEGAGGTAGRAAVGPTGDADASPVAVPSATATAIPTPVPSPGGTRTPVATTVPARLNRTAKENFNDVGPDGLPAGWTACAREMAAEVRTDGANNELVLGGVGTACLLVDGARWDVPDVRTRLRFLAPGGRAGITVAWRGPGDYVAVVADEAADRVGLVEVAGGAARVTWASAPGSVPVVPGRNLWLRAEAGRDGAGRTWVTVWWSPNGKAWRSAGYAEGLGELGGGVGLLADGGTAAFDNLVARPSGASGPAVADATPAATATAAPPAPPDGPVAEQPGSAPTAGPMPTEAAAPEPPTPMPTPEPPPTATVVPTEPPPPTQPAPPTEPPAPEKPPADGTTGDGGNG